jgi:Peptidase M15
MICFAFIACIYAIPVDTAPEVTRTEIVATGRIPMPPIAVPVRVLAVPSPRPERAATGTEMVAYAPAAPSKRSPFEAILKGRLKLIKVDGNEVVDRFSPDLLTILKDIQAHFGRPIEVQSGYRSPTHNKRVGGARKSLHMRGRAADIRVQGVSGARLLTFLRSHPRVGGIGYFMAGGFIHIDDGRKRTWRY